MPKPCPQMHATACHTLRICAEDTTISPLNGGLFGDTYLLQSPHGDHVLKGRKNGWTGNLSISTGCDLLQYLGEAELPVPEVVDTFHSDNQEFMAYRFIPAAKHPINMKSNVLQLPNTLKSSTPFRLTPT